MRGVVCGVFLWTAVCSDVTEQSENLSILVADIMVVFKTAILLSWSLLGR